VNVTVILTSMSLNESLYPVGEAPGNHPTSKAFAFFILNDLY